MLQHCFGRWFDLMFSVPGAAQAVDANRFRHVAELLFDQSIGGEKAFLREATHGIFSS